jgi:hypothetical protein
LSCGADYPLVTVVDRESRMFRGPEKARLITAWLIWCSEVAVLDPYPPP